MAYAWSDTMYASPAAAVYPPVVPEAADMPLCEVWKWNLSAQMLILRQLVPQYGYITVDVKFPGILARPIGTFHSTTEFHYQTLRANIDLIEPVQIGLTITDAQGNIPPGTPGTWQFNMKFDPNDQMCSQDGLEILRRSGLDLEKHRSDGIEPFELAEVLTSSGLLLSDEVTWITFHAGYDLGLVLAMLRQKAVPAERSDFLKLLEVYFPIVWDVKTLVKAFNLSAKNFLHEVAEDFQLIRGTAFLPAGADSRLAALCFYEILRSYGENLRPARNCLFGLGEEPTAFLNPPVAPRMYYPQ